MSGPNVTKTEVDGVTCFYYQGEPPMRALLAFRVGAQDESFLNRGISHFVEHLTLQSFLDVDHHYNGFVDGTTTNFLYMGDADGLLPFLVTVCERLRRLPADRVDVERSVLLEEERQRNLDGQARHLRNRFGLAGLGALGFQELGLRWLPHHLVQQWADQWFTKANAVLVLSGPPPEGIRLDLVEGDTPAAWGANPLSQEGMAMTREGSGGVVIGVNIPRSDSAPVNSYANLPGLDCFQEMLMEQLRKAEGLIYTAIPGYFKGGLDNAEAIVTMACSDANAGGVAKASLSVLDEISTQGPAPERLRRIIAKSRIADESAVEAAAAFQEAWAYLHNDTWIPWNDAMARSEAVTVDEIRDVWKGGAATTLLMVPANTKPTDVGLPEFNPGRTAHVMQGTEHRYQGVGPWPPPGSKIVHDREALTLFTPGWEPVTIRIEDVVGLLVVEKYRQILCSRTGATLSIWPGEYENPRLILDKLAEIPRSVVLEIPNHQLGRRVSGLKRTTAWL